MTEKDVTQNTFAELERIEDKYIIKLEDLADIKAEIEKYMNPAYLVKTTKYVLINSIYFDSQFRDFFRLHVYGANKRTKVRARKYGPNGVWDEDEIFLEIKDKDNEDVHKSRIQLDKDNLANVQNGLQLAMTDDLRNINSPLYTTADLRKFVNRFNKLVAINHIKPVLSITYKRLAYGRDNLRVTIDTDVSSHQVGLTSLGDSVRIRKSVDWKTVKEYKDKYSSDKHAILEVKHESNNLPSWLTTMLDNYKLKPEKFSKYVWASFNILKSMKESGE